MPGRNRKNKRHAQRCVCACRVAARRYIRQRTTKIVCCTSSWKNQPPKIVSKNPFGFSATLSFGRYSAMTAF